MRLLRGVATEDVRDLYLEGRNPAAEYGRMAGGWRANVVRISVRPEHPLVLLPHKR